MLVGVLTFVGVGAEECAVVEDQSQCGVECAPDGKGDPFGCEDWFTKQKCCKTSREVNVPPKTYNVCTCQCKHFEKRGGKYIITRGGTCRTKNNSNLTSCPHNDDENEEGRLRDVQIFCSLRLFLSLVGRGKIMDLPAQDMESLLAASPFLFSAC